MKACTRCLDSKPLTLFYKDKRRTDGRMSSCSDCFKLYYREKYKTNEEYKELKLASNKNWEKRITSKESRKVQHASESYRAKKRTWKTSNFTNNIQFRMRSLITRQCNGNIKRFVCGKRSANCSWLGCSLAQAVQYLETKFYPHPSTGILMTWANHGRGHGCWQIDHIKPLKDFDLSDKSQLLEAANYKNTQPLWFEDHEIKRVKECTKL